MPHTNTSSVHTPTNSGEIVLYKPNSDIHIEVRLENETVWLTQQQIADLFGVKQPAISKHLANIFKEGELDKNSVYSILEYTAADGKVYNTQFYNLDAILSVGYRVNSINATLFRRWATEVLKEYMLRGYNVNQQLLAMQRQIDSRFENQNTYIDRRLNSIENELADHRDKIDFFVRTNVPPVEQVFFEGQFFEARALLEKMVKTAQKRVIIIDSYIDAATFEILDVRQKGVTADIYSNNEHSTLCNAHNSTSNVEPIHSHKWTTASHDRWLIIDDNLFHCGHSLKDMGKKLSAIMLMGTSPETILNAVK